MSNSWFALGMFAHVGFMSGGFGQLVGSSCVADWMMIRDRFYRRIDLPR
jgi:hypothetical protein